MVDGRIRKGWALGFLASVLLLSSACIDLEADGKSFLCDDGQSVCDSQGVPVERPTPDPITGENCDCGTAAAHCEENLRVERVGSRCLDTGECAYDRRETVCPDGCTNGVCNGNPCLGVECATPPPSVCLDNNTLRSFGSSGTCSEGGCSYAQVDVTCRCREGRCIDSPCIGLVCTARPSICRDEKTLESYGPGTCAEQSGVCNYETTRQICQGDQRCRDGACRPLPPYWESLGRVNFGRNPSMAYDANRNEIVVIGSIDATPRVWTGTPDGSMWTEQVVNDPNFPVSDTKLVYDAARRRLFLFGGRLGFNNNNKLTNATWQRGAEGIWAEANDGARPDVRFGHTMSYDASASRVLMFGGRNAGDQHLDDTWSWDGQSWTQLTPAERPPARRHAASAFDTTRRTWVLYGGEQENNQPMNDLWEFDGTTWRRRARRNENVTAASGAAGLFDEAGSRVLFIGGRGPNASLSNNILTWNGTDSGSMAPAGAAPKPRYFAAAAMLSASRRIIFGGGALGTAGDANALDVWAIQLQ